MIQTKCLSAAWRIWAKVQPRLSLSMRSRRAPSHPPLHGVEQVGPYGLRAQIATPQPSRDRVHEEQRHGGDYEEAREVIDLLRPQLDEVRNRSGDAASRPGQPASAGRVRGSSE